MMPTELWPHQREALDFIAARGGNAVLWMQMGTGKTRVAIDAVEAGGSTLNLVLCPKSVIAAWREQLTKFGGSAWVGEFLDGGSGKRKAERIARAVRRREPHKPLWIVVNYEAGISAALAPTLLALKWGTVVYDESHRAKAPRGKTSELCYKLAQRATSRLLLTGTLMPHSPLDVWSQARLVDQGLFGWRFVPFRSRYAVMGGFQNRQVLRYVHLDELESKLARITFRVDSNEVLDLPPVVHVDVDVSLSPAGLRAYMDLSTQFETDVGTGVVTAANALTRLLRLQQLTGGWLQPDEELGDDGLARRPEAVSVCTAKHDALRDLFDGVPASEPFVVFGVFRKDLATVHDAAESLGRSSLELSGSRRELAEWQAGAAPILAVQLQSGGTGIDLTRAAYCAYLSTGFSLGNYEQSLARLHRPGQTKHVTYYHVRAAGTVDVRCYTALANRKDVVESILSETRSGKPLATTRSQP